MAARRIPDPKVGGSNPSSLTFCLILEGSKPESSLFSIRTNDAFLAQMVERWPFKPMVAGSIPAEGASFSSPLV